MFLMDKNFYLLLYCYILEKKLFHNEWKNPVHHTYMKSLPDFIRSTINSPEIRNA